jgi:hypothetical protein
MTEGRPSVGVVVNGGGIVLDEVDWNIRQNRTTIVIAESGAAADAMVSVLKDTEAPDDESAAYRAKAESIGLAEHRELFRILSLRAGPKALAQVLQKQLGTIWSAWPRPKKHR